jgi:hypothetical protein
MFCSIYSDGFDWKFVKDIKEKGSMIPGTADAICPDEIKDGKIQSGNGNQSSILILCEKYLGPNENQTSIIN